MIREKVPNLCIGFIMGERSVVPKDVCGPSTWTCSKASGYDKVEDEDERSKVSNLFGVSFCQ